MRVLILGAGGHAQVVADILLRMRDAGSEVAPIGFLDDDPGLVGRRYLGLPVLGTTSDLAGIPRDAVLVAIGDNATRQRLFRHLQEGGERFAIACHPRAILAPDVQIGPGSMVCAGAVVNTGTTIGANVILNTACSVDHHNQVGDHTHIAPGVHLGGQVTIGEGCFVAIGSSVIPGRTIGPWSMIGVGSAVTKDIPSGVMAVGIPARVVSKLRVEGA
jgi:sugar O-acyltransferase (sialic acid O-acetyltransferase NeuD family)